MEINDLLERAQDAITARRVFGEPYQQDGVTVIPAARVVGGGGGGGGSDGGGQQGEGGGFGLRGRPVGAWIIEGGHVRWQPAVDANRAIGAAAAVVIVLILTRARRLRAPAT